MSHYQYSHPVSATELKKWGVFTNLNVRNHNKEELAYQGSRDFIEDVSKIWDSEISWKCCAQTNGHMMALSVPECLPERLALVSAICDMVFLQDDIFENTTDAQRNGTQEELGDIHSVLKQKGLPIKSLAMFPELKNEFIEKMLVKDPTLASYASQELDRVAAAPPRDRMTYDTLDSYIDERLRDISAKWFFDLCAYGMDLKLNEHEQEQSLVPTLAIQKAIIYTNDLFSWAKEKAEQEKVALTKDMFSAVAVLMKEHRVSEKEALDWVRMKTTECEKDHFAAISDLEAAGPISENLYRYFDMTRLCHSGLMLWSAFTMRYSTRDSAQTNGEVSGGDRNLLAPTAVEDSAKMGVSVSIS